VERFLHNTDIRYRNLKSGTLEPTFLCRHNRTRFEGEHRAHARFQRDVRPYENSCLSTKFFEANTFTKITKRLVRFSSIPVLLEDRFEHRDDLIPMHVVLEFA
jgi:hypothetical protein